MAFKQFKIAGLNAYVLYEDGRAKMIINQSKNDYGFSFRNGKKTIAIPNSIDQAENSRLLVETKQLDVHSKIVIFCRYYKDWTSGIDPEGKGVVYKITNAEKKLLDNVTMSEELLQVYFKSDEWWCKQKNVKNYINNLNNIMILAKIPLPNKTGRRFPSEWSRLYEGKLKPSELAQYWAHLRSLGLMPIKDNTGRVIKWQKQA